MLEKATHVAALLSMMAVAGVAHADMGIDLQPIDKSGKILIDKVMNYVGSCGGALVRVQGFDPGFVDHFFESSLDTSIVIIPGPPRNGPKPQLTIKDELSDYNMVACIDTNIGAQLLLATQCGGSACGGGWSYSLIDPNRLTIFPKRLEPHCDKQCMEKRIGRPLPPSMLRD